MKSVLGYIGRYSMSTKTSLIPIYINNNNSNDDNDDGNMGTRKGCENINQSKRTPFNTKP